MLYRPSGLQAMDMQAFAVSCILLTMHCMLGQHVTEVLAWHCCTVQWLYSNSPMLKALVATLPA